MYGKYDHCKDSGQGICPGVSLHQSHSTLTERALLLILHLCWWDTFVHNPWIFNMTMYIVKIRIIELLHRSILDRKKYFVHSMVAKYIPLTKLSVATLLEKLKMWFTLRIMSYLKNTLTVKSLRSYIYNKPEHTL